MIAVGHKPLREMSETIEMIALPSEGRLQPAEERLARVGVMAAHAQDTNVQRDQRVAESGELKSAVNRREG